MIRFILIVIFAIIFFILTLPLLVIALIGGLFSNKFRFAIAHALCTLGIKIVVFVSGVKVTYIGLDNIPKDRSVLYTANHCGFFDIILTYPILNYRSSFISKQVLSKVPVFAQWMKCLNCLFLDRKDIKSGLKMVLTAIEMVKNGTSIFIFPEGTRSRDGKLHDFKEGSFKIATKSECPVIPVAISNTAAVFEDQFPKVIPQNIIIEFGTPIETKGLSRDDLKFIGRHTHDIIAKMLEKNYDTLGLPFNGVAKPIETEDPSHS